VTARRVLLDGLARDADIFQLASDLASPAPAGQYLPRRGVPPRRRGRAGLVQGQPGPTRCPWRDYASGSCLRPPSAVGRTRSSSTRCWPQQPSAAGPNRTCLMRSPGGRPTTSGSTPCTRRPPASAPPPVGRRPCAPGMPRPGRSPWQPSAITTSLGCSESGHLPATCLTAAPQQNRPRTALLPRHEGTAGPAAFASSSECGRTRGPPATSFPAVGMSAYRLFRSARWNRLNQPGT
jgi:hypothetical protein